MIDYHEKFYVRARHDAVFSTETYPLGFATPYSEDAAGLKRQETVDAWAKVYDYEAKEHKPLRPPYIMDNTPQVGFSINGVVSRSRTDNKWFQVRDPRGFELQISSYNLFDLIDSCTIVNGVIQDPLVWGRFGGNNYLDKKENMRAFSEKKTSGLTPGDKIEVAGYEYVFIGTFFMNGLKYEHEYEYAPGRTKNYWGGYNHAEVVRRWHNVNYVDEPKKVWLLYRPDVKKYTFYKSAPKHVHVSSDQPFELPKFDSPYDRGVVSGNGSNWHVVAYFFHETRADMEKMDRGLERTKAVLEKFARNSDRTYSEHHNSAKKPYPFNFKGNEFTLTVDKPGES